MLSFLKGYSSGVHAQYSVQSQPVFSVGCWSVYDAKSRSTKEPVSVFVCDRRALADTFASRGIRSKSSGIVVEATEQAMREAQQLTKMRHPALLRVVAPLEKSSRTIQFVTERVTGTLGLFLRSSSSELDDLTIVRGASLVVEALQFLHTELGLIHLNVSPDSILLDAHGEWKLAGLGFVQPMPETEQTGTFFLPNIDPRAPSWMQVSLDYTAPEIILDHTLSAAADVWSLSCVLWSVYNGGQSPIKTRNNADSLREEMRGWRQKLESGAALRKLPVSLKPYIPALFAPKPEGRIALSTLLTTDYFDSPLIKALRKLDEYATLDSTKKVSFLKHLTSTLLPQFPKQIRRGRILTFAIAQLQGPREEATGALLGTLAFQSAAEMSQITFGESVLPLFSSLGDWLPFQEALALNVGIVVKNTRPKEFTSTVAPVIVGSLKINPASNSGAAAAAPVQVSLLKETVTFIPAFNDVESKLFPAVVDLFAGTPSKAVKIACINSCREMMDKLSKTVLVDRLVPTLQAMKTRDAAVVIAVSHLWASMASRLDLDRVAEATLPHMLLLSMAPELTESQYHGVMKTIRSILDTLEKDRAKELHHNVEQEEEDWFTSEPQTAISSDAPVVSSSSGSQQQSESSPGKKAAPSTLMSPTNPKQASISLTSTKSMTPVSLALPTPTPAPAQPHSQTLQPLRPLQPLQPHSTLQPQRATSQVQTLKPVVLNRAGQQRPSQPAATMQPLAPQSHTPQSPASPSSLPQFESLI